MVGRGNHCICNLILLLPCIFYLLPQTEGPQRELLVLTRERQVLVLQLEALRTEAQQAERDLQDQRHHHQTELQCLREESLQVHFFELCEEIIQHKIKVLYFFLLLVSFFRGFKGYLAYRQKINVYMSYLWEFKAIPK